MAEVSVKTLVVGVTGASGAPLAVELLRALRDQPEVRTILVVSRGTELTLAQETDLTPADLSALADETLDNHDLGAKISSGSFRTDGMMICPCSMKTLAGIHAGYADDLIQRAADVTLKEGRKLVLVPRECPFSPIHLRNLYELSMMGVVILPPVVSYYQHPQSARDMTRHLVGKLLDCFGLDYPAYGRWEGMECRN